MVWSEKGKREYGMKKGNRTQRVSMIAALNDSKIKAACVFEGNCDRDFFELYLTDVLVPELTPGKVIILDNASFHKGGRIVEIIEAAGCTVLYLPPYSPDFNPIEHYWAKIKNGIRKLISKTEDCLLSISAYFFRSISNHV